MKSPNSRPVATAIAADARPTVAAQAARRCREQRSRRSGAGLVEQDGRPFATAGSSGIDPSRSTPRLQIERYSAHLAEHRDRLAAVRADERAPCSRPRRARGCRGRRRARAAASRRGARRPAARRRRPRRRAAACGRAAAARLPCPAAGRSAGSRARPRPSRDELAQEQLDRHRRQRERLILADAGSRSTSA